MAGFPAPSRVSGQLWEECLAADLTACWGDDLGPFLATSPQEAVPGWHQLHQLRSHCHQWPTWATWELALLPGWAGLWEEPEAEFHFTAANVTSQGWGL